MKMLTKLAVASVAAFAATALATPVVKVKTGAISSGYVRQGRAHTNANDQLYAVVFDGTNGLTENFTLTEACVSHSMCVINAPDGFNLVNASQGGGGPETPGTRCVTFSPGIVVGAGTINCYTTANSTSACTCRIVGIDTRP